MSERRITSSSSDDAFPGRSGESKADGGRPAEIDVRPVSDEQPAAENRSQSILDLLAAYDSCLAAVSSVPRFVLLRRSTGRVGRFLFWPRVVWPWAVRFFAKQHTLASLGALERAIHRDTALNTRAKDVTGADLLDRIAAYRQFLGKKPPYRLIAVLMLTPAILVSYGLVGAVEFPRQKEARDLLEKVSVSLIRIPPDVRELSKAVAGASTRAPTPAPQPGTPGEPRPDTQAAAEPNEHIEGDDLVVVALAMGALLAALYLVLLLLPLGGFVLKRLLFNLHPAIPPRVPAVTQTTEQRRAVGLYEREDAVFRLFDARPPVEIPFDLLRKGLYAVPVLLFGTFVVIGYGIYYVVIRPHSVARGYEAADLSGMSGALLLVAVPSFRLISLNRIWRARRYGERKPDATVRSWERWALAAAVAASLILFMSLIGSDESDALIGSSEWVGSSLAFALAGIVAIAITTWFAPRVEARPVLAWLNRAVRVLGIAEVGTGVAGLLGFHHWPHSLPAVVAILVATALASGMLPAATRRLPRWVRIGIPAVALGVTATVVSSATGPIADFPTKEERAALDILPAWIRSACSRTQGVPQHRDAAELVCFAGVAGEPAIVVGQYTFPRSRSADRKFRGYIDPLKLPRKACDMEDFNGVGSWHRNGRPAGKLACYSDELGDPWLEWTMDARGVYAYSYAYGSHDKQQLRQLLLDFWDSYPAG